MNYKAKNTTSWRRLWGIFYSSKGGYKAALEVYKAMPKTFGALSWRIAAFTKMHWKWLIGSVLLPIIFWVWS